MPPNQALGQKFLALTQNVFPFFTELSATKKPTSNTSGVKGRRREADRREDPGKGRVLKIAFPLWVGRNPRLGGGGCPVGVTLANNNRPGFSQEERDWEGWRRGTGRGGGGWTEREAAGSWTQRFWDRAPHRGTLHGQRGLSDNNVHCLYFSLAGREENGKSHDLGFRAHG